MADEWVPDHILNSVFDMCVRHGIQSRINPRAAAQFIKKEDKYIPAALTPETLEMLEATPADLYYTDAVREKWTKEAAPGHQAAAQRQLERLILMKLLPAQPPSGLSAAVRANPRTQIRAPTARAEQALIRFFGALAGGWRAIPLDESTASPTIALVVPMTLCEYDVQVRPLPLSARIPRHTGRGPHPSARPSCHWSALQHLPTPMSR
jgi:hypothetical protein